MLSEAAEKFIRGNIRSTSALEVLLYLRDHESAAHDAASLARALRGNEAAMGDMLAFFASRGLLGEDAPGVFRYRPATPETGAVLAELARALKESPFALMEAILAAPSNKITSFANAFRLKGE